MTAKILVLGQGKGNLRALFAKATALHDAKGFTFAIATGDLFGPEDDDQVTALLAGSIEVPLLTYFTVGTTALPQRIADRIVEGEEIAPNLRFLSKRSSVKTADGVRIVVLGGLLDPEVVGLSEDTHLPFHTIEDTKALKGTNSADILLTSATWPDQVWVNSEPAIDTDLIASIPKSPALAELCAAVKPLYILSSSPGDFFFERKPFWYDFPSENINAATVCRFLSLAPFGNAAKAKALYAFGLPATKLSIEAATACPFVSQRKRKSPDNAGEVASYSRFSTPHGGRGGGNWRPGGGRNKRARRPSPGPQECFLCLGNNTVGAHMVVSIGTAAYLATAKGPLPTSTTFAQHGMTYPAHMLIIPIEHGRSVATMKDDSAAVFSEMTRFRTALQSMVGRASRHKLGSITFEISLQNTVHVHWQFIPVPAAKILSGLVEEGFKVEAENQKMGLDYFEPEPELADAMIPFPSQRAFFRIWLHAETEGEGDEGGRIVSKTLVADLGGGRFHFKYPRRVVAMLMEMEDRDEWQKCTQNVEEETADVEKFREAWQEWDFTLAEEYGA